MMRLGKHSGFSLIELITALALLLILSAVAYPAFKAWQKSAMYKEAARNIVMTLRDARARAVTTNLQHRVIFDVDGNKYQVDRGNLAYSSTSWPDSIRQIALPAHAGLESGEHCDEALDVTLVFSPNGSCDSAPTICVMDTDGIQKFKVTISSATTGRVVID